MLSRLLVAPGESVAAGDVFAVIESADLLEWQRAFLDASIEAELASLQLERDAALVADGIVAERRLEEASARDRAAAASVDQARQQLAIAGYSRDQIQALARSGQLTSRLELRVPIDGVVTDRFADPGSRVAAMDPILSFADLSEVWVEMHLNAERAVWVESGMRIVLPVAGASLAATITVVGAVIDPETQTVLVRAALENPDRRLRAGQFFSAEIVAAGTDGSGFSLPAAALVRNGDEAFVFVREESGFRVVRVEPEHEDDRQVLIGSGIDGSMRIAVRGTSTLKSIWMAAEEGESQ
jgi:RND family efflux transporter MFP subunit